MEWIPEMTPDRIRAIRESLGLTQEEAGNLLGGGPRAFTKYEAGSLKPRAAAINLLRVLEEYPDALRIFREGELHPVSSRVPAPFEVKSDVIATLKPPAFTELLRRLLSAEAQEYDLPHDGIHVGSSINVPDGGEDGRISWRAGPERTRFLPSRLCQFQLKTGKIDPARAGKEVVTKGGAVRPMIRLALEQGGHYIMLCAHPYTQKQVEARQRRICDALRKAKLSFPDDRIRFWEVDQIAAWVNFHQSVALWVREEAGLGTLGGFASWNHWKGRSEHSVPWVEDPRLADLCRKLRNTVTKSGSVLRVVGLSGIGKSRLCLEALKRVGKDEIAGRSLRDLVMYAVQSEVDTEAIYPIVEKLAVSGGRAIVIVDDCDARGHVILAGLVLRSGSHLSLVTIDNEIPSHIDATTIKIGETSAIVIESIVDHVAATWQDVDRYRLARLSQGFPEVAIRIAKEFDTKRHLIDPADDYFIDEFICGRSPTDQALLLQSAQLLAVFGPIRVEPVEKVHLDTFQTVGTETSAEEHLVTIADLGRQLTRDDLYTGIQRLDQRDVVECRGGLRTIQPRPIATRLAERQWREWDERKWDRVLSGDIGSDLSVLAARRLAELNATKIANNIAVHVCRESGPFDQVNGIVLASRAEVLATLAEISADAVAERINHSLDRLNDLRQLGGDVRRHLVRALSTIAFHSGTFMIGARLLLRLAVTANAFGRSDASRQFVNLFSPLLGGTEADGNARLLFLDEATDTSDQTQLEYVIKALIVGCRLGSYERMVGPEVQGSLQALEAWHPTSKQEWSEYIVGCVNRLGELAARDDAVGIKARDDLGGMISSLVCNEFLEAVEEVIHKIVDAGCFWALALRQLRVVLNYDSERIDDETVKRVRSLIDKLEPTSLEDRVQIFVTEPPMPGFWEAELPIQLQNERERAVIEALAAELLRKSTTLMNILPDLSSGRQIMANELGESLAKHASTPLTWLEPIAQAVVDVSASDRNYGLLSGFVAGLPARFHDEAEDFKSRAIGSRDLASAFPKICKRAGLTPKDITRAVAALNRGTLSPWDLHHWAFTWVLDKVSPADVAILLDAMLDHSAPAFALAVTTLGRILADEDKRTDRSRPDIFKLADFRPQVLKMVRNAGRWSRMESKPPTRLEGSGIDLNVTEYHFEKIVLRMLDKGREDSSARATALALALTLAHGDHHGWINPNSTKPTSVLTRMLAGFPEIVWPLVGGAIVGNPRFASRMSYVLGCPYTFGRDVRPPILDLPEDTLFAWCHANPDGAPAFAAKCVPILPTEGEDADGDLLHPVMSRLLDEFGDRDDVRQALESNIHTYSWFGSSADHYARLQEPLKRLRTHPKPKVRRWAEKMCRQVARCITRETRRDEEREAQGVFIG